jgi:hypothetical protein
MSVSRPVTTPRPATITVIAILLTLIALFSAVGFFTTRTGLLQPRQQGNFQQGGNFQGGGNGGNFQGGGNSQRGNGNFQPRGGFGIFSLFGATRTLGINFQVISYVSIAVSILGIALTLVAAYGVWKQKRWALNLALVLTILFLLGALPGLFTFGGRTFNLLRSSLNVLRVLATLPIIVLGILPSVRDSVS